MAIEYNFTLDMDRSKRDNNIAYARTGDVDSITINADLVLNGAAYTPSGTNAFFECITPNGHSIRTAASKTGSTVSVDVPSAAFQAAGVINVAYFRFESGEADNPTYVESTEPFAIVVREGIGDNIDAGDYIEEWRGLADQLEAIVAEVEQKAEQAEAAINEQKTEVDQLKAQAQTSMAQDAEDVSEAKDTAISNINGSQVAVDAAIEKLEQKTQEAVDATQEALDGTLAANLQDAIDRTLKLDVADMVNIVDNSSLSSLTNVGSYCCKTAASAATISDSPIDDSPFNMYVFSSSTSGQVMQLVVPIDLNGKPTAEWHVRFGTSSAMDPWSVIGGGADIAAGLGIDVTGDAQKTVSLDTAAFYQHHEATDVIQGSTEVTGGGRIKGLTVYGSTRQNLWMNPSGTNSGITATANDDGSVTLGGTSTAYAIVDVDSFILRKSATYTIAMDKAVSAGASFRVRLYNGSTLVTDVVSGVTTAARTFTMPDNDTYDRVRFAVIAPVGTTVSGTYRIMLNEGATAEPWCPPGLNGVGELSVVTGGANLLPADESEWTLLTSGLTTISIDGDDITVSNSSGTYQRAYVVIDELAGRTVDLGYESVESDGYPVMQLKYNLYGVNKYINASTTSMPYKIPDRAISIWLELYSNNDATSRQATATYHKPYLRVDGVNEYSPLSGFTTTSIDLDGHTLNSLPDGTRDELSVDATGAVTLVKRTWTQTINGTDLAEDYTDNAVACTIWGDVLEYDSIDSNGSSEWYGDGIALGDVLPTLNSAFAKAIVGFSGTSYSASTLKYLYVNAPSAGPTDYAGSRAWLDQHPLTLVYKLAEPQTISLPSVTLPELASPGYTVYASSNVPVEVEADVVKVDYLPPSDVYTKEEVDKKIEDAGGMPDIVPVSKGGTGVTTAAAERNRLGLGNTTGALPVANGGTGATTNAAAMYNITKNMYEETSTPTDETIVAFVHSEPSSSNGGMYKRKINKVWDYIVTKIRSTFGFNSSNVLPVSNGGTGATSAASARTNFDVYSKAEVDGKVPKVVYGTGNIPGDAANGTIYIQYRS